MNLAAVRSTLSCDCPRQALTISLYSFLIASKLITIELIISRLKLCYWSRGHVMCAHITEYQEACAEAICRKARLDLEAVDMWRRKEEEGLSLALT